MLNVASAHIAAGILSRQPNTREALYDVAVGLHNLHRTNEARRHLNKLLEIEPSNSQALALKGVVDEETVKDGALGAALVAGAVYVGSVIFKRLWSN
jgi:fission 1 protein